MQTERTDDPWTLPNELQEALIDWCQILVDNDYDLGEPTKLWESAAYLVANGHTDEYSFNVDETAVILAFATDKWHEIKKILSDDEEFNGLF